MRTKERQQLIEYINKLPTSGKIGGGRTAILGDDLVGRRNDACLRMGLGQQGGGALHDAVHPGASHRKFKNPELRTEEGAGGAGERSSLRCEEGRSDRASGDSAHLCFVSVLMASFFVRGLPMMLLTSCW